MSNLQIVRMLSGEDVLAKVERANDEFVSLDEAVVIIPSHNNQVQFVPYAPFVKKNEKVLVKQSMVVYIAEPAEDFVDHHRQMFSGLVVAK